MSDQPVQLSSGLERLSRRTPHTDSTRLTAMATMLLALPRPVNFMEAIAIPCCGMGESQRMEQGVGLYNHADMVPFLLAAGGHPMEIEHEDMTPEVLIKKYGLKRGPGGVRTQLRAFNTVYQTDWWAEQVAELALKSVMVIAPQYHAVRLICTFLRSMANQPGIPKIPGTDLPSVIVVPMPVMVSPSTLSVEDGVPMWDMVPGELERMPIYQAKGDVVSYDAFATYMAWLWQQPEIAGAGVA